MRKALAGFIIGVILAGCGAAATGTGNDTVFHEDNYQEFFKKEGNGDKNYLYTVTEQDAPEQRPVACRDRQRQRDDQAERQCGDADPYMVAEIVGEMRQRLAPARVGEETHAAPSRGSSALSRSASRRGVRRRFVT